MPMYLSERGAEIAHWIEAGAWATETAPAVAERVRGLPDWRINQVAESVADGELDEEFEQRVAACAYQFGTGGHAVRAVMAVMLRDLLIAGEGRTAPTPKDGRPRYGEPQEGPPGWRKALGVDEGAAEAR